MSSLKKLIKKYGHIWIMAYFAIYLPWFLYLEKHVTTRYHVMHSVWMTGFPLTSILSSPIFSGSHTLRL